MNATCNEIVEQKGFRVGFQVIYGTGGQPEQKAASKNDDPKRFLSAFSSKLASEVARQSIKNAEEMKEKEKKALKQAEDLK